MPRGPSAPLAAARAALRLKGAAALASRARAPRRCHGAMRLRLCGGGSIPPALQAPSRPQAERVQAAPPARLRGHGHPRSFGPAPEGAPRSDRPTKPLTPCLGQASVRRAADLWAGLAGSPKTRAAQSQPLAAKLCPNLGPECAPRTLALLEGQGPPDAAPGQGRSTPALGPWPPIGAAVALRRSRRDDMYQTFQGRARSCLRERRPAAGSARLRPDRCIRPDHEPAVASGCP